MEEEDIRLEILKIHPEANIPVEFSKQPIDMNQFFDKFGVGSSNEQSDLFEILDIDLQSCTFDSDVSIGDIVLKLKIGQGCFGVAYLGQWSEKEVVVKKISTLNVDYVDAESLFNEVIIMERATGHPNIGMFGSKICLFD